MVTKLTSKLAVGGMCGLMLWLSGCENNTEGFVKLEESAANLNSQAVSVSSWYPKDETVIIPSDATVTLGIALKNGNNQDLTFSYYIDDSKIATSQEPFYNLSGRQLPDDATQFTITASSSQGADSHTFAIQKNAPPVVDESSPVKRSTIVDCSNPLLVFSASASDPEGQDLEFTWTINDAPIGDKVIVESSENRSRAAITVDCTQTLNESITVSINDGLDTTEVSWIYMDPTTGALGEVGNSAIEFDPISYDFGFAKVNSDSLTHTFTATNPSFTDIYIEDFTGANDHFTLSSNNCPMAPESLSSGDDCTIAITFAPTSAGSLGTNLSVSYYAAGNAEDSFKSLLGLAGTGVSPLVFSGVQGFSNKTHNSVTLSWNQTSDASSFVAFQVTGRGASL
jgi:hypothetical protein